MFGADDLTEDSFLGGRLRIVQPAKGYRAGIDPVLLAAATPARSGDTVLELGLGVGVASLCLATRVGDLRITGLELQKDYAELARKNAVDNRVAIDVVEGDVSEMPQAIKARRFNHVLINPPYFLAISRTAGNDRGREIALSGVFAFEDWIEAASRRLSPSGWLTVILRVDRLPELISACQRRLGSLELKPIAPRHGRETTLVILRARKGGRAAFRLYPPLVLHAGARHERDGESFCPEVQAVLREAKALAF